LKILWEFFAYRQATPPVEVAFGLRLEFGPFPPLGVIGEPGGAVISAVQKRNTGLQLMG
jgi:hypothetical protein